jgi:hypothetical protein
MSGDIIVIIDIRETFLERGPCFEMMLNLERYY